jgi:hypothetical protein
MIQTRGDTAANWTSANPVLHDREQGIETDTKKIKIGDGITAWTSLKYTTIRPSDTKVSIVDADEVGGNNSAASFGWVKWTWDTVKSWLAGYFAPAGYGIGPVKFINTAITMSAAFTGGGKYLSATLTDAPSADYYYYEVIWYTATDMIVVARKASSPWGIFQNVLATTWSGWRQIFNTVTDGNGGQPPAPKPQVAQTASKAGYWECLDVASGASQQIGPASSGSWAYAVTSPYGATVTDPVAGAGCKSGIISGGSSVSAASTNLRILVYRVAQ